MRPRSLSLAFAVAAITMSVFASAAMAADDGVLREVNAPNDPIAKGTKLHLVGWTQFEALGTGMKCDVTYEYEALGADGKTGRIISGTIHFCSGFGSVYAGCEITSYSDEGIPYHVTITPTDVEIDRTAPAEYSLSGCKFSGLTFSEIRPDKYTLKPLKTGTRVVTNTSDKLGDTAAAGDPIAGFEEEGIATVENDLGEFEVAIEGEFELTSPGRCTYKITAK